MTNGGNGHERSYHPQDKAEGVAFMARLCLHCKRHELYETTQFIEDECLILLRSVHNKPGDILYPPEWITTGRYRLDATCTAVEARR